MKCINKETFTLYLDNELPANKRKNVEVHLESCQKCREQLQAIKKDTAFIQAKLELVKPRYIPEKAFTPTRAVEKKPGIMTRMKKALKSSIRVPVPAMAFMLVLVLFMGVVLVIQGQKISQLKSPLTAAQQQTTLYLISENRIQSVSLEADLAGFEPIKKPKIFVAKE